MVGEVFSGGIPGFYLYMVRGTTWKGGDPSSDEHIPFNPITESTGIKLPQAVYDLIASAASLYPTIEVDKSQDPTTITLRTYFREPFQFFEIFPYKALPSSWTGTSDTITANFTTSRANLDKNIGMQLKLPDPAGGGKDVTLFFDGGTIEAYRWDAENQGAVFEEIDIKFAEISDSTTACDIDDGFDDGAFDTSGVDGGWAWWNRNLWSAAVQVLLTQSVTVEVAGADPPGLAVQSWNFEFPTPHKMDFVASSRVAGAVYEEVRGPWKVEFQGLLDGDDNIAEAYTALASKTKRTITIVYGTSPLTKTIQITNAVLKSIDGLSVPAAGESIEVTYVYEGAGSSLLTYVWVGTEADDPSDYINHTDV